MSQLSSDPDAEKDNTPKESAYCRGSDSGQPFGFCLADRKHERAERDLAKAIAKARRGAIKQKQEIGRSGPVTLAGDPLRMLDLSQKAWEKSYRADCLAAGLSVATGNAGTEGVTTNLECEAVRIFERARFLDRLFS